jgi:glyceraldehyde 3-phosphate dehydrogenase
MRVAWDWPEFEFVRVNDPAGDAATFAHLLEFDSVHGRWDRRIGAEGDALVIEDQHVPFSRVEAIDTGDWSGCDVVIEASGKMRRMPLLEQYLAQGVGRVVVTAPVK